VEFLIESELITVIIKMNQRKDFLVRENCQAKKALREVMIEELLKRKISTI
jgi:hypothetical protein